MSTFPLHIYSANACRQLDAKAINEAGVGSFTLMRRAADAAKEEFLRCWSTPCSVDVLCGAGNNGGDGYLVAAGLKALGCQCRVFAAGLPRSDDAKQARTIAIEAGVEISSANQKKMMGEVIVDALLGIGLSGPPRGEIEELIGTANASSAPILSLDVPSGLDVDTGLAPGVVIQATTTVTFIGLKLGLMTGYGPNFVGQLVFADLGVSASVYQSVAELARLCDGGSLVNEIPVRTPCAHKGKHGHATIIGGNHGMSGALRIASEAALRSGAGLVTAVTRIELADQINSDRPELMVRGVEDNDAVLVALLQTKQVIGIGPGLGRDEWAASMMMAALDSNLPLVIDADGLNWLAENQQKPNYGVLTPHPAEAARLLGCSTEQVQSDRYQAVIKIARQYDCICVLKGCGSLISNGQSVYLCDRGNPGMASAGMGDCLTGVITALIAQGMELYPAARCGVWLHARAADLVAAQEGMVGMLASDLFHVIKRLINRID